MTITARIHALVQAGASVAEAVEQIVPGADVAFWTRRLANYRPGPAPRRRRQRRRLRRRVVGKRTFRASQALARPGYFEQESTRGRSLAELVDRANKKKSASGPVTAEDAPAKPQEGV